MQTGSCLPSAAEVIGVAFTEISTIGIAILSHGAVKTPEVKCPALVFFLKSSQVFHWQCVSSLGNNLV